MAVYQICFFTSVAKTGVAVATMVAIGTAPILAGMLGFLVRGESPGSRWAMATALAVTGCSLLIAAGGSLAHDRKRLTVKVSVDECRTWPYARVIEPGPSGYSDLAEAPDGAILCIYECGMIERMTDTRSLTVARFGLDWAMGEGGGLRS